MAKDTSATFHIFGNVLIMILILFNAADANSKDFQGRLEIVRFINIDNKTQSMSSDVGYNGASRETITVSEDKVLVENKSLLYSMLFNLKTNQLFIWCEKMEEGIIVNCSAYVTLFSTFAKEPRYYGKTKLPQYLYNLKLTQDKLTSFGISSSIYSGRLECDMGKFSIGTDFQCEMIPSYSISQILQCVLLNGLNINNYMPIKFRWTSYSKGSVINNMKNYIGWEVQSIDWDYIPNDAIFSIPQNIQFKNFSIEKLHSFYKKIGKYLRKNNLFPDQTGEEFIYEINEEEWSY